MLAAFVNGYEAVVLEISVHVVPPLVEVCHLTTLPVCPLNVIVPLLLALHNAPPEYEVVPPTEAIKQEHEAGLVVMVVALELASEQLVPLLTTALYC